MPTVSVSLPRHTRKRVRLRRGPCGLSNDCGEGSRGIGEYTEDEAHSHFITVNPTETQPLTRGSVRDFPRPRCALLASSVQDIWNHHEGGCLARTVRCGLRRDDHHRCVCPTSKTSPIFCFRKSLEPELRASSCLAPDHALMACRGLTATTAVPEGRRPSYSFAMSDYRNLMLFRTL